MRRAHRELRVWQESIALVELIYRATKSFPSSEQYCLTSQLRRAVVSVPPNIAEGSARSGTAERLRFLGFSAGSLSELDTLIELAQRLGYLQDTEELRAKVDNVSGLLMGLQSSLRKRDA